MDVYLASVPGGDLTRLTDADTPVWTSILSPDGGLIAYPGGPDDALNGESCDETGDVTIVDRAGCVVECFDVAPSAGTVVPGDWGPDGERLLVGDDSTDLDRVGVYDRPSGSVTWFGTGASVEEPECFLPDGHRILVTRIRDTMVVPVVYDLKTGEERELQLDVGVVDFGYRTNPIVDTDRLVVAHETAARRPRLLEYDLVSDTTQVVLGAEYGPFDPETFASPSTFTIESTGKTDTRGTASEVDPGIQLAIDCLLYEPDIRPAPLVVKIHGGPHQADRHEFDDITQFLVQCGYSVLNVNYRGSSGRGRTFQRALYGDWGGAEQGDIARAVEHALAEHDWLDENRVAVFGGSFGGYSAAWQLVQYPELYSAGVAWVPMTDLVDMYKHTVPQFRAGFLQRHLGTPDEHPALYRERSPITHVENLDAPVLLLHGVNDPRTPVSQARRFRDAIIESHGDSLVEYHEFDDTGHGSGDSAGRERLLRLVGEFIDRRLDGHAD